MVGHGQMHVIWVQGVVDAANDDTGIVSMVLADEEVGVVANAEGEMGLDIFQWDEASFIVGLREAVGRTEFRTFFKDLL